ncbi:hypothetical protein QJS04_geneDACA001182 [Acorus gramineus]|uniref:Uncharacterized protein n=1 Tax=Acorus gramineus TaxID=55184 RepID=A0AAV9AET2_ACOGR|nr:hypothetical protein QJS04_geneDACA001182 [Acorus gramineus]
MDVDLILAMHMYISSTCPTANRFCSTRDSEKNENKMEIKTKEFNKNSTNNEGLEESLLWKSLRYAQDFDVLHVFETSSSR